ncbi:MULTISPECIES: hypothetical protein [Bacillus cereus group]|uniref:hypothetical protein n=1 Tax=Bacillus cereus group TaxID=86661 RepID=UPI0014195725|nr:hypothetical protein [Bacillus cereus]
MYDNDGYYNLNYYYDNYYDRPILPMPGGTSYPLPIPVPGGSTTYPTQYPGGGGGLQQGSPSPPSALVQKYHYLKTNPAALEAEMKKPRPHTYGCGGKWTFVLTGSPTGNELFLMYVMSTSGGYTSGYIYPYGTVANFPTSQVLWYLC